MGTRILSVVAIVMTVVTGGLIYSLWAQKQQHLQPVATHQPAPAPQRRILIAKRDLIPGSFIHSTQDLGWGNAPPEQQPAATESKTTPPASALFQPHAQEKNAAVPPHVNAFIYNDTASLSDFNGSVVRYPLHIGEPVPPSALIKPNEGGFLPAVLKTGMVAVTIAVNATSGNAGFVSPGDHVDLIATHHIKLPSNTSGDEQIESNIFIHDIRVVAIDQMLENPENKAILAKTVTVEVTPRQAEEIAIAGERGKISIALLSNAPDASSNSKLVENHIDQTAPALRPESNIKGGFAPRMQVIHGDQIQEVEFYRE